MIFTRRTENSAHENVEDQGINSYSIGKNNLIAAIG